MSGYGDGGYFGGPTGGYGGYGVIAACRALGGGGRESVDPTP